MAGILNTATNMAREVMGPRGEASDIVFFFFLNSYVVKSPYEYLGL